MSIVLVRTEHLHHDSLDDLVHGSMVARLCTETLNVAQRSCTVNEERILSTAYGSDKYNRDSASKHAGLIHIIPCSSAAALPRLYLHTSHDKHELRLRQRFEVLVLART